MEATEARQITDKKNAPKKPSYQRYLDRKIRRLAARGESEFILSLYPEETRQFADYLRAQGYRVTAGRYLHCSW